MKKILFLLLLISGGSSAQTLYKTLNGVKVEFSASDYVQYRVDSAAHAKEDSIMRVDSVDATTSFAPILTAFQPMTGKTFSQLTATQKSNMMEAVMWKLGIINRQRLIKPLDKWLLKQ